MLKFRLFRLHEKGNKHDHKVRFTPNTHEKGEKRTHFWGETAFFQQKVDQRRFEQRDWMPKPSPKAFVKC